MFPQAKLFHKRVVETRHGKLNFAQAQYQLPTMVPLYLRHPVTSPSGKSFSKRIGYVTGLVEHNDRIEGTVEIEDTDINAEAQAGLLTKLSIGFERVRYKSNETGLVFAEPLRVDHVALTDSPAQADACLFEAMDMEEEKKPAPNLFREKIMAELVASGKYEAEDLRYLPDERILALWEKRAKWKEPSPTANFEQVAQEMAVMDDPSVKCWEVNTLEQDGAIMMTFLPPAHYENVERKVSEKDKARTWRMH